MNIWKNSEKYILILHDSYTNKRFFENIIYILYITITININIMCVIYYMNMNGQHILAKNRDLPYNPEIDIIHEIVNGVEVVYMMDKKNGWIEGINEFGIGMVNSSLLEDFHHYNDYNMRENKMYKALINRNHDKNHLFDELLKKSDKKYILEGHSLIAHNNTIYHLENTPINKHIVNTVSPMTKYKVFSNHGVNFPKEGLTDGRGAVSSFLRRELTKKELHNFFKNKTTIKCDDNKLYDELSSVLNKNYVNIDYRFHPYRSKSRISNNILIVYTSAQLLLNITNKEFVYFKDKHYTEKVTYINKLPRNYVPKIRVIIKETEKNMTPVKKLNKTFLQKIYKRFHYKNKTNKNTNKNYKYIQTKDKTRKNKK